MSYLTLGYRLPRFLSSRLFGDRKEFGLEFRKDDPCWKEWEKRFLDFYGELNEGAIGTEVNRSGYRILQRVDMNGKRVLEVGPGSMDHLTQWSGSPAEYVVADVRESLLEMAVKKLEKRGITAAKQLLVRDSKENWPFKKESFDVIVSFYVLEHMYPLEPYLERLVSLLKPGGTLVGAIPCEGGMAWGTGRFLTSRRWFLKNTTINPDKIICWEHPNFAPKILKLLDKTLKKEILEFWPFRVPSVDGNLIARFVYRKPA